MRRIHDGSTRIDNLRMLNKTDGDIFTIWGKDEDGNDVVLLYNDYVKYQEDYASFQEKLIKFLNAGGQSV